MSCRICLHSQEGFSPFASGYAIAYHDDAMLLMGFPTTPSPRRGVGIARALYADPVDLDPQRSLCRTTQTWC